ncbi:MAG: FKBP-type peptidyl-prolyl cis-trans isomerase [Bacteroidales bacterium]|jgi:FKBP-type peptidyl-prolyl cis-trans isomerase|nr:FKBP-type peptidyl-prolyl cis-trans isomerase [Bacteroidales bacterium]MBQ2097890.1 FKBP-type peptidyl-prolyl cis-trans isomerase [Bacteroidales bacterium]
MKRIIIIAAVIIGLVNAAAAQKYYNKVKLATTEDSISYCIGVLMAKNFIEQGMGKFNADAMGKAFSDVNTDKTLAIPQDDITPMVNQYFERKANEEKEKALAAEKKFLDENAKDPEIKVTASGLQYRIVKEGTGKKPTDTSAVRVHYEGKLADGTVFDSSFDNDEPVEFNVDNLIPGMTEGLLLMSEGSEYIIYIPSELGYGDYSPADVIPANSTLIFDIELIQVINRIKDDDDDIDFDFSQFDIGND